MRDTDIGEDGTFYITNALSSTIKRRLRREPGAEVPLLDQVPEAMLPLALFGPALGLGFLAMAGVTLAFTLLDVAATGFRHGR